MQVAFKEFILMNLLSTIKAKIFLFLKNIHFTATNPNYESKQSYI